MVELLQRVTQHLLGSGNCRLGADNHHLIAHLQLHALIGDKIDTGTVYARDVDAVACAEAQIRELLAVNLLACDEYSARYERRRLHRCCSPLVGRHLHGAAKECEYRLAILLGTYHSQTVANRERALAIGHDNLTRLAHDARYDKLAVDEHVCRSNVTAIEHRIGELHRVAVREVCLVAHGCQALILLLEVHAHDVAHDNHREDDADNAQRIGHGISE